MLSRIAESLFWIGRYIERSDGTARIIDVHLHLLLEDHWTDENPDCRSLLTLMGTEVDDDAQVPGVTSVKIHRVSRSNIVVAPLSTTSPQEA